MKSLCCVSNVNYMLSEIDTNIRNSACHVGHDTINNKRNRSLQTAVYAHVQ